MVFTVIYDTIIYDINDLRKYMKKNILRTVLVTVVISGISSVYGAEDGIEVVLGQIRTTYAAQKAEIEKLKAEIERLQATTIGATSDHAVLTHSPREALLVGTDTGELLESIMNGSLVSYVEGVRARIKAKAMSWIDAISPFSGPFLANSISVGGIHQPADHSRDAFKFAIENIIDAVQATAALPINASLKELSRVQQEVDMQFIEALEQWINTLSPINALFLDATILSHGHLLDNTRDTFRNAMMIAITE